MAIFGILALVCYARSIKTDYFVVEAQEKVETPFSSLTDTPSPQEVKQAVNYMMVKMDLPGYYYDTLFCESGFNYKAYNPNSREGSYGVAQFIPSTFYHNCTGNIKSTKSQILCSAKMFKEKKQGQWDCYCLYHIGNKDCQARGFK